MCLIEQGIYEELYKLRKRKQSLQEEAATAQYSIPEERERLVQQIKLLNQSKAAIQATISEQEQEIVTLKYYTI